MFDRPEEFCLSDERIQERITLAPGEVEKQRYNDWLAGTITAPRYCLRHPRTPLVLVRSGRLIEPAYKNDKRGYRVFSEKEEIEPGAFHFLADLRCPACRCAYALCPPEFHQTGFDTFDTSTCERATNLAKARDFASQVNQQGCGFALLVGPTGTGKTRLACNIIGALEDRDALYVRQGTLTTALRSTYGRKDVFLYRPQFSSDQDAGKVEPPKPLDIVYKVRMLVLDEIGCTALANDERLLLNELLKHRYDERKPTVLISNLPLTGTADALGLKQFLGDALTDRIREATGNRKFIVRFFAESYRRTTGENYLNGIG